MVDLHSCWGHYTHDLPHRLYKLYKPIEEWFDIQVLVGFRQKINRDQQGGHDYD